MKKQPNFNQRGKLTRCVCSQAVAFVLFGILFTRADTRFWLWLSLSATTLSIIAVLAEPREILAELVEFRGRGLIFTVVAGLASAVALYGVFYVGNIAIRHILPFSGSQIEGVYELGQRAPQWLVALLLLLISGPGEEIFWRGYVQRRLSKEFGWTGELGSVLVYSAIHIATGNLTLVLAALVCGVFWALLYRHFGSLWINIISHGVWGVIIFVLFPMS